MAQTTTPHTSAISAAAIASRSTTDMRRMDGEIAAGGWPSPGRCSWCGCGTRVGIVGQLDLTKCYNVTSAAVQSMLAGQCRAERVAAGRNAFLPADFACTAGQLCCGG